MQQWNLLELNAPDGTRDPIVLHSDDGARAVVIVLSPGQSLGEHQVKENAWVTVLEGTVEITAGGEVLQAGAGTMVRFDPDERHALRSDDGARVLMLLAPWPGEGHYRGGPLRGLFGFHALTDAAPDTAHLARVGLERRHRYALRPTRTTCLVWDSPASTPTQINL